MRSNLILQLLFNGLASGSLYAIVGLGFGLVYNTTRIFHLSHGLVYTAAGYLLFGSVVTLGLPLYLAVLASSTGAMALGVLMELLIYRPLSNKEAPATILFISSLGIYILVQNLIILLYGNQTRVIIYEPQRTFYLGPVSVSLLQAFEIVSYIVVLVSFRLAITYTRLGKVLKAVSDNSTLAEVVGINLKNYRLIVFALGSLLAGLAAILSAFDVGIDPNMGFSIVLISVASMIIGGVGVLEGALLGGILIGVLQALSIWQNSGRWQNTIVFLILVAFLLFKPEGLLGSRKRLEEVRV